MTMGPCRVTEIPDQPIVLDDGTRLSARLWLPENADRAPVPAILEYLPYRKRDGTVARDALTHPWFASHGYACLRVDIRGNGDSQGLMADEYTPRELDDAVQVIGWIARQRWCSGAVGMMGISWGGFNALQVAALAPEPLKAIITLCSTVDRFADDIHYKGGCLLNENLGWGATMLCYSSRAPDRAVVGRRWRDMWLDRLRANPFLAARWLKHQRRDAYWRHGSVCEDFSAIKAATLAVGGWGDGYKNAVPALVENLSVPVKGIVGPWIHKYPHFATPEPRIGFLQEALRWWDRWLKDLGTGVERDPDLRLFLQQSEPPQAVYARRRGRWIAQSAGPRETIRLHLAGDRLADAPAPVARIIDSPADTGRDAGEYCAIWQGPDLPGDQRRDDALSTCFDGAPLRTPLAIAGAARVTLRLTSDVPVAQLAVRLNDLRPDGSVCRITYGVLNLTHRDNPARPAPMPVGRPVEVTVTLDQVAYELPAGHRLRLSLSNAYWPLVWPAPGRSRLRLSGGNLTLPLADSDDTRPVNFAPPQAAPPWPHRVLRPETHQRETVTEHETGVVTLRIRDDFGAVEDADHGLISDQIAREWWSIHPDDPLSATGRTHWTDRLSRGDWRLRTESWSRMWCDGRDFHLWARVEAYEGDTRIFERDYRQTIARDLV